MEIEKDELLGYWENDVDDRSGFHTMVWGFAIEFLEDGKGIDHQWGASVKPDEKELNFLWKRTGDRQITFYYEEENEEDVLDYELSNYGEAYYKMTSPGKDELECYGSALYKIKKNEWQWAY